MELLRVSPCKAVEAVAVESEWQHVGALAVHCGSSDAYGHKEGVAGIYDRMNHRAFAASESRLS